MIKVKKKTEWGLDIQCEILTKLVQSMTAESNLALPHGSLDFT